MPKHQKFIDWCRNNNYENLIREWDVTKNLAEGLNIETVYKSSNKKAWWICEKGHSFDAYINNRTSPKRNDQCPFCSGHRLMKGFNDLKSVVPELALEWDYESNKNKHDQDVLNGVSDPHPCSPSDISFGSGIKVFWKCKEGHISLLSPNERHAKKDGSFSECNKCADISRANTRSKNRAIKNNLVEYVPMAIDEWQYSEHDLTPRDVSCHSKERVHWKCKKGHEFDKRVCDRVSFENGKYVFHMCSKCSKFLRTSMPEQIFYYYILKRFPDAVNGFKDFGTELDIFIPSISVAVEYDGSYFHKDRLEKDNQKDIIAAKNDITLFRIRDKSLPDTIQSNRITVTEKTNGVKKGLQEFFNKIGVAPPDINIERDYNDILSIFEERIGQSVYLSEVISEWDYDKNEIDPKFIRAKDTNTQVWWKCPNGHPSYLSYPYNRTVRKTGCRICKMLEASKPTMKKVINIDTQEIYESGSAAELTYGKKGNTAVLACCRGKRKSAYGYHWQFYNE